MLGIGALAAAMLLAVGILATRGGNDRKPIVAAADSTLEPVATVPSTKSTAPAAKDTTAPAPSTQPSTTTIPEGTPLWQTSDAKYAPLVLGSVALVGNDAQINVHDSVSGARLRSVTRAIKKPCPSSSWCSEPDGTPLGGTFIGGIASDGTVVLIDRGTKNTPQNGVNPATFEKFWLALNARTGTELWRLAILNDFDDAMIGVSSGNVIIERNDRSKNHPLVAFDLLTGVEKWSVVPNNWSDNIEATYYVSESIIVRLMATEGPYQYHVDLIDPQNGQLTPVADARSEASSLVGPTSWQNVENIQIFDGLVLISRRSPALLESFDQSGRRLWSLEDSLALPGSRGPKVTVQTPDKLEVVDALTGAASTWSIPMSQLKASDFTFLYSTNKYIFGKAGTQSVALSIDTGEQVAVGFPLNDRFSTPSLNDVYWCQQNGGYVFTKLSERPEFFDLDCRPGRL